MGEQHAKACDQPLKTFYFVSWAQVLVMATFHLLLKKIVFRGALYASLVIYHIRMQKSKIFHPLCYQICIIIAPRNELFADTKISLLDLSQCCYIV
jgi:hypothetical protein